MFTDRHVEDLKYHDLIDDGTDKPTGFCYFQFIVLFFESFFSTNFVILKDVAVIFQWKFSGNTENLGGKYFFGVFATVSFSPLIRPFFALNWTSTDSMLIKYCWNQRISSRKCLHDLFSLKVLGAYMKVLDGRELGKVEVRPFLELFLHTEMAQNFIFHLQSLRSCFQNKHPSASAWC